MFDINNIARATATGNGAGPALLTYSSETDDFATISASGYFNDYATNFDIGDWIYIKATDTNIAVYVTAISPNVTVDVVANFDGALGNGQIFVGNGSNVATPRTMSGDVTMSNTGVTTIGKVLDGSNAANTAANTTIGALPVLFPISVAGGATANYDVIVANKITVIDVWVQFNGAGATGDSIQVLNSAAAITNAMDGNAADQAIVRAGSINDANATINSAGTLRVTQTDATGNNAPPCTVYVLGWNVA